MHWIAGVLITYKLCGIATGLKYLHSNDVVHGNLGPVRGGSSVCITIGLTYVQPNILVDDSGRVRITDFGLTTMPRGPNSQRAFVDDQTVQWTAPEILNGRGTYSKEADVFSFAMVMIEVRYRWISIRRAFLNCRFVSMQVLTDAVPFGASKPSMAGLAIMKGNRPLRPAHPMCSDKLWKIMQRCWAQESRPRPGVSEVLGVLRGLSRNPPSHPSTLMKFLKGKMRTIRSNSPVAPYNSIPPHLRSSSFRKSNDRTRWEPVLGCITQLSQYCDRFNESW